MEKRLLAIEKRESKAEEEDEEEDAIEEIFVEEDEDEDEVESEEKKEVEVEEEIDERKKRVCTGIDGERKAASVAAASATSTAQRCQADSCEADLGAAKRYHQRHKVCESHSKAKVVLVGGLEQRYCQQCSRYIKNKKKKYFFPGVFRVFGM